MLQIKKMKGEAILEYLDTEDFPFFQHQNEKSPNVVNDTYLLFIDNDEVVAYISWRANDWDWYEEEGFDDPNLIHLTNFEVAESLRGKGLGRAVLEYTLKDVLKDKNIFLQANTRELITTYKGYGFNLVDEEAGNLMTNF